MRVDVLGCAGSRPGGGQACSGYLVTSGSTLILVDAGFGVASRLTGLLDPGDLDAIVVSHRHLDHSIDVLGLFRSLWAGEAVVPVFAAPEVEESLTRLVGDHRRADWDRVLPWTTVTPGDTWRVGDVDLSAFASDHPVPTVSLRIADPSGATLCYSADSGGGADLVDCARGADLFLCEATWQTGTAGDGGDGHLAAADAGRIATDAAVGRLLLTHLRPDLDPATSVAEAAATFAGPVEVARDGDRHDVRVTQ